MLRFLIKQLGLNGLNAKELVYLQDDAFAQNNLAAMDSNMRRKNAKMSVIGAFNRYRIV